MRQIKQILSDFNPIQDKYISREFQTFGLHLAESLNDTKHKSLYIKLAKNTHRSILEKALSFAIDSTAQNKGALFMWKLKQLKENSLIDAKTAQLSIVGEVQEVGFRQFIAKNAAKRNLKGYITNKSDGSVYVVVTGTEKKIIEIISLCKKGPRLAKVSNVDVVWLEKPEKFTGFTIK